MAEPIYRETLKGLDDERLGSEARCWIWQRETALHGPDLIQFGQALWPKLWLVSFSMAAIFARVRLGLGLRRT